MRSPLSWQFYFEVALGLASVLLLALTQLWNDWIEAAFRVDPDAGNGSAEFMVSVRLLTVEASVGAGKDPVA